MRLVRLHLKGCTIQSLDEEFNVSKRSISNWTRTYRVECPNNQEQRELSEKLKLIEE